MSDLQQERVRELARALECATDEDLQVLANVKDTTTEAWRKRGTGPAYVRLGQTVLYPLPQLKEFLFGRVRAASGVSAKEML